MSLASQSSSDVPVVLAALASNAFRLSDAFTAASAAQDQDIAWFLEQQGILTNTLATNIEASSNLALDTNTDRRPANKKALHKYFADLHEYALKLALVSRRARDLVEHSITLPSENTNTPSHADHTAKVKAQTELDLANFDVIRASADSEILQRFSHGDALTMSSSNDPLSSSRHYSPPMSPKAPRKSSVSSVASHTTDLTDSIVSHLNMSPVVLEKQQHLASAPTNPITSSTSPHASEENLHDLSSSRVLPRRLSISRMSAPPPVSAVTTTLPPSTIPPFIHPSEPGNFPPGEGPTVAETGAPIVGTGGPTSGSLIDRRKSSVSNGSHPHPHHSTSLLPPQPRVENTSTATPIPTLSSSHSGSAGFAPTTTLSSVPELESGAHTPSNLSTVAVAGSDPPTPSAADA